MALEAHDRFLAKGGPNAKEVGQTRALLAELYEALERPEEAARWRE